jgi:hypothetical protein
MEIIQNKRSRRSTSQIKARGEGRAAERAGGK